ncbi:MAG: hypothetical protein ACREQ5_07855 [Candidatus Dormibacteria bacterium]
MDVAQGCATLLDAVDDPRARSLDDSAREEVIMVSNRPTAIGNSSTVVLPTTTPDWFGSLHTDRGDTPSDQRNEGLRWLACAG